MISTYGGYLSTYFEEAVTHKGKMAPIHLRLTLTVNICLNDYYNIFKMLTLRTHLKSIKDRSVGNAHMVRGT